MSPPFGDRVGTCGTNELGCWGAPPLSRLLVTGWVHGSRTARTRRCDFHHGKYSYGKIKLWSDARSSTIPAIRRSSLRHFQLSPSCTSTGDSTSMPHLRTNSGTGSSLVRPLRHRLRRDARTRPPTIDRARTRHPGSRSSDAKAERST